MGNDATGRMEGRGAYGRHSLAQHSAGELGLALLERAVAELAVPPDPASAVVIADLGAAGGRNELAPMRAAVSGLRDRHAGGPIVVVHTDIPTNDFSTLFATIEHDPGTYLGGDDVFVFAAGRSFYERIFPVATLTLGWSSIAVHWLSRVPEPIADHVYCAFATGSTRDALAAQSADDWTAFLVARAAELRPGAQMVIVGGAAADDGSSGAEALMDALDESVRDAVRAGTITDAEYRHMTIPTWNRTLDEFTAPFARDSVARDGVATAHGLELRESSVVGVADQYLAAYHASGDASTFASGVSGFVRAFTEPSLVETLDRPAPERAAIADAVYEGVRARAAADPDVLETIWHVSLLRIARADTATG